MPGGQRCGVARNSSTSRPSIGCVRFSATQAGRGPAGARSAARETGTSASGRRPAARRAARSTPARRPAAPARPPGASRGGARASRRGGAARRDRRSGAPRPRPRPARTLRLAALDVDELDRALHRVDQVVGDLDAVQRRRRARAGRGVADHELVDVHLHPVALRPGEAAHRDARHGRGAGERRADVARHTRHEDLHPLRLKAQTRRLRDRHPAKQEEKCLFVGICGENTESLRFAGGRLRAPLAPPAPLRFDRGRPVTEL